MITKTFSLYEEQVRWLEAQQPRRGGQSSVIRRLIDKERRSKQTPHERVRHLIGCLDGPKDLSTRKLTGYGTSKADR